MSGTVEKQCVYCGLSCAGEPRIKSADGKYAHKSCAQARGAGKARGSTRSSASAAAVPVEDDAPMAAFLDDLPAPGSAEASGAGSGGVMTRCGGCGKPMSADAVVCMGCGFNARSGSQAKTTVKRQQRDVGGGLASVGGVGAKIGGTALAPVMPMIGACIGGGIGAAIWAAVAYNTQFESSWIALLVGVLTGIGAVMGAGRQGSAMTGLLAVAVTLISIGIGKYIAVSMFFDDFVTEQDISQIDDEIAMQWVVDEIVYEDLDRGIEIGWDDPSMTVDYAIWPDDYPVAYQDRAYERWRMMNRTERDEFKRMVIDDVANDEFTRQATLIGAWIFSFMSPFNLLFIGFGIYGAWKFGTMDEM